MGHGLDETCSVRRGSSQPVFSFCQPAADSGAACLMMIGRSVSVAECHRKYVTRGGRDEVVRRNRCGRCHLTCGSDKCAVAELPIVWHSARERRKGEPVGA